MYTLYGVCSTDLVLCVHGVKFKAEISPIFSQTHTRYRPFGVTGGLTAAMRHHRAWKSQSVHTDQLDSQQQCTFHFNMSIAVCPAPRIRTTRCAPQSFEPVTTLVSAVIPAHSSKFELNNSEYNQPVICTVVFVDIARWLLTTNDVTGEWSAGVLATTYVVHVVVL